MLLVEITINFEISLRIDNPMFLLQLAIFIVLASVIFSEHYLPIVLKKNLLTIYTTKRGIMFVAIFLVERTSLYCHRHSGYSCNDKLNDVLSMRAVNCYDSR